MSRGHRCLRVATLINVMAAAALITTACHHSTKSKASAPPPPPPPPASSPPPQTPPTPVGQKIFRSDTFGDEAFWTDKLKMNQVIATIDPLTAASVGLKIDADALPPDVVKGIEDGSIPLDDPQTTLALIQMNAVVGIQGDVETDAGTGERTLKSVGISCALCHSTVSTDVHVVAHTKSNGDIDLSGIAGHRLDGWPNRDLNPGAIIALSPAVANTPMAAVYKSWGPGKYDARFNLFLDTTDPATGKKRDLSTFQVSDASTSPDGTANAYDPFATLIPPAYGLKGIEKEIYTGDGDLAHEPVGPLAYWNRYVAVTQMGGIGAFDDPRLDQLGITSVDHIGDPSFNVHNLPDQVSSKLKDLQAYQFAIAAPQPPEGSFDAAAAQRGQQVFATSCASCHSGALLTDANIMLHPRAASVARDTSYLLLSATQEWRTSPLHGIWQHPPYLHDGSGVFIPKAGKCADGSDIASLANTDTVTEDMACMANLYNTKFQLGLTDSQRADLVAYLKSL